MASDKRAAVHAAGAAGFNRRRAGGVVLGSRVALRRAGSGGTQRLLLPVAAIVIGALAVIAVLDRLTLDERAAERRALLQRNAELNVSAVAPGSALACLDGGAGEAIENACEKAVFADPQSAAAAVAYTAARLALLADAHALAQNAAMRPSSTRSPPRAARSNSTATASPPMCWPPATAARPSAARPFAWLRDTACSRPICRRRPSTLTSRATPPPGTSRRKTNVAEKPPQVDAPAPVASAPEQPAPSGQPVSSRYDFPSAASIPPVSIMNAEPPLPKDRPPARRPRPQPKARPRPCRCRQNVRKPKRPRRPRANIAQTEAGRPHVQIRPDRQSRRDRLPHRPHRQAAGPAHHRGLFARPTRKALHVRLCDEAHAIGPRRPRRAISSSTN